MGTIRVHFSKLVWITSTVVLWLSVLACVRLITEWRALMHSVVFLWLLRSVRIKYHESTMFLKFSLVCSWARNELMNKNTVTENYLKQAGLKIGNRQTLCSATALLKDILSVLKMAQMGAHCQNLFLIGSHSVCQNIEWHRWKLTVWIFSLGNDSACIQGFHNVFVSIQNEMHDNLSFPPLIISLAQIEQNTKETDSN